MRLAVVLCLVIVGCAPVEAAGPPGSRTVRAQSELGDDVSVSLTGKDDAYVMRVDGRDVGHWQKRGSEWIYASNRPELVLHAGGEVAVAGCRTGMLVNKTRVVDRADGSVLYELSQHGELGGPLGEKYRLRLEPYDGDPQVGFLLILPLIHVIGRGDADISGCDRDPAWPS
jgi:hypothetical protein